MRNTDVYMSPLLTDDETVRMNKPFAHTCDPATGSAIADVTVYWGGYGYNYQYLGNARTPGGVAPFHAKDTGLKGSQTIAIADTHGSKNGGAYWTSEGVYVVDPPLMSMTLGSKGSRKSSPTPGGGQYGYSGGNDGDPNHRSTPAERNRGKVNVVFCDGHAEAMKLKQLDDFNGDGQVDNGWWNGKANARVR
jgi:prepilin-type processing-associated H-X9-DG protein